MKIFPSRVNARQRASTSEEALNNQADRMTQPADVTTRVVSVAGMEAVHGRHSLLKADLAVATAE